MRTPCFLMIAARGPSRGSALVFALCLVLALAVLGIAIVRIAGNDRISAARMGVEDRGLSCAEAGLQFARRVVAGRYEASHGWNDYLDGSTPGFRYDPDHFTATDAHPASLSAVIDDAKGDFDGDGQPDFWVSIRDDDDERPLGAADRRDHDNNEMIIIRSECMNPRHQIVRQGRGVNVMLESTLAHIQGGSGYGTSGPTNSPDIVGAR